MVNNEIFEKNDLADLLNYLLIFLILTSLD